MVSVADRGTGIDEQEQMLVFDKFFRAREHRFRVPGSGMGLAISRSIVESHGGRLWATANNGQGATFHFTLPIAAEVVRVSDTGT